MLPGFRFLFVTTVMSVSVLVFAIGAAALLRATHDSFATFPTRRAPQEQVFVKPQFQTATPTIALLRVEAEPEPAIQSDPTEEAKIATPLTSEALFAAANVALNFPDPPAAAIVDLDALRREVTQSATIAAVETTPAAEPTAPASEIVAADPAPEQTASFTPVTSDDSAKFALELRKNAEAAKIQIRKLEATRRVREARAALQRRRIAAAARARAVRQTQTQTQAPALFNPAFGTN